MLCAGACHPREASHPAREAGEALHHRIRRTAVGWDRTVHSPSAIFDAKVLFAEFKIQNATFFCFLDSVSRANNMVPHHNWWHPVDVTQFVAHEIAVGTLQIAFTKLELLMLFITGICHDANRDGFGNVCSVQTEIPLGILFKKPSVMETHHCEMAILVLSRKECQIFAALDPLELGEVWNMVIKHTLVTDMAENFTFLKEISATTLPQ
jgi:hypothetical protein